MISISCLESKLLNNNNWYGRFQLAPFQKGEGLTVANALRRTLLAEKSNFFISWVDFYNAEIPYSVLTGMRESIFDILLNLKQVIFTSDNILPNSGDFLKTPLINNFRAQKVKFFPGSKRFTPNEGMGWNTEKTYNFEPKINFLTEPGLNLTPNNVSNQAKQRNQNLIIGSYLIPSLGVKRQAGSDHSFDYEISKSSTNSWFSVDTQKNVFKPPVNQSINMLLAMTKKNKISKTQKLQNFKNQKIDQPCFNELKHGRVHDLNTLNHGCFKSQNLFCQNQILGKTNNLEAKISSLVPLGIFRKSSSLGDPFLDISSSKRISNSTYIGYICAKGPAIIYAKNIKLPKGLKCVDPDKYIVTLADDGLFYLRFALTTEIKTLPLGDASNLSVSINQSIKFNTVRLETGPKTLFNKEIQSCFSFRIDPFMPNGELKSRKLNQQYFNSSQIPFSGSYPTVSFGVEQQVKPDYYNKQKYHDSMVNPISPMPTRFRLNSPKQKYPLLSFIQNTAVSERKIHFGSNLKLDNSKMWPVNYTKDLINEQRLLLTNDSIKQFNFQNTSMIANIQKTCLLNIQIKHYYYKCGRFDRFLYDLLKPFKPILKSTHYNKPSLKGKERIFYQDNSRRILTYFLKTFERQKYASQLSVDFKLKNLKKPVLEGFLKKKHLINKLLNKSSPQSNINSLEPKRPFKSYDLKVFESYLTKNKYFGSSLLKWQKIFRSIRTNSMYDYLQKLSTSEAALICFLPIKSNLKSGILLLDPKLIPIFGLSAERFSFNLASVFKNYDFKHRPNFGLETQTKDAEKQTFLLDPKSESPKIKSAYSTVDGDRKHSYLWVPNLHEPYLEKFLNLCLSFQCSKNHILYFLKSYILQYNNSLGELNNASIPIKNKLRYLLFRSGSSSIERLITKIKWLRQWLPLSTEHSKETKISLLKKKTYIFPLVNSSFLVERAKLLEVLSSRNQNQISRHDNHLRKFYHSKKQWPMIKKTNLLSIIGTVKHTSHSMDINGYMLAENACLFGNKEPSISRFSFIPLFDESKSGEKRESADYRFTSQKHPCLNYSDLNTNASPFYHDKMEMLKNQPWIRSNRYQSFDPFRLSTSLRSKPSISIRQISCKPVWMFPCQFQQNTDRLISLLGNGNLSGFPQAQTNKNKFLDLSYEIRETVKTTFNQKTNNSIALKPIYLNVEQIIYILKQTTKFRKNQRINPVFFNLFSRFNTANHYPLDYRLMFSKVSDSLYNSLHDSYLFNKIKQTTHQCFLNHNTRMSKKIDTHRLAPCHVWVLGSDFVFKNHSSDTTLKSHSDSPLKSIVLSSFNHVCDGVNLNKNLWKLIPDFNHAKKEMVKQFFFTHFSKYSICASW